ncbi:MAG TPA: ABC transporter ATP-binding protein [Stellaceae bacterium]|nr:ABC transporter ATP-binding protein [Stellaceae bacterium]
MEDASTPLLALVGVGKSFRNGIEALARIDLAVAEGAFLSILGPSGCGKSTLLRIIAGLTPATAGRVAWQAGDLKGRIGFVFQEPTLMPWANIRDNVFLPLRLQGKSRREEAPRIDAMLAALGLAGFERVYPRELSGGMRMRVSIARALVTEPRLLLMDEPFAALDEITRFKLNEDLLDLWRQHRCTIVFVTHSVFESVFLSDRIVIMTPRPGRIVSEVAIDLPYPRRGDLRTDPAYVERCGEVSRRLARATA